MASFIVTKAASKAKLAGLKVAMTVIPAPRPTVFSGEGAALKEINDDYAVERVSALRDVYLDILPEASFMEFMRLKGKIGSQHKFPRVLKGKMLADWKQFLETGKL